MYALLFCVFLLFTNIGILNVFIWMPYARSDATVHVCGCELRCKFIKNWFGAWWWFFEQCFFFVVFQKEKKNEKEEEEGEVKNYCHDAVTVAVTVAFQHKVRIWVIRSRSFAMLYVDSKIGTRFFFSSPYTYDSVSLVFLSMLITAIPVHTHMPKEIERQRDHRYTEFNFIHRPRTTSHGYQMQLEKK